MTYYTVKKLRLLSLDLKKHTLLMIRLYLNNIYIVFFNSKVSSISLDSLFGLFSSVYPVFLYL